MCYTQSQKPSSVAFSSHPNSLPQTDIVLCHSHIDISENLKPCAMDHSSCSKRAVKSKATPRVKFADLPSGSHISHVTMYKNLKTQVLADVKKAGLPSSAAVPRMHAAWQSLSQYAMSDGHWQDGYCKTVRSMEDDIDNQTRNPFRLSIDAVFPFTLSRGQMMYHAPGHLVVTALYIHLMKSTFIPAMLAHVAEYIGSDHKSRDLESFMQKMENVYLVGLQSPFTIKARIKTKVSVAEHASIKREWVAGCVTNGQGRMQYIQKHYVHMPKNAPSPDWRPEGFDRIRNLIVAIEGRFPNECLRRGPDGCPFPFHEPNMPSDWSWWSCWRMFNERFVRMKEWCNRNHESKQMRYPWKASNNSPQWLTRQEQSSWSAYGKYSTSQ